MPFKEIVGQDAAASALTAAYKNNRLAQAYLCAGPDGVGKKATVLNFIKLLFCEDRGQEGACCVCPACLKIETYNHADVHWVQRDGQFVKVDAVRQACRQLSLKGFESSRKVLVIPEAQHLNDESSSALLKTLEEPGRDTTIFLLVDSVKSVLPTIVSRCQRIVFSSLSEEVIAKLLRGRFSVEPQNALYLARISQGSLGRALKYHQSGLFERKNKIIDNVLDKAYLLEKLLDTALLDKEYRDIHVDEILCVLSSWFRDVLLAKASLTGEAFINFDRKEEILRLSRSFSLDDIDKKISSIAEMAMEKRHNVNMRLSFAKLRVELWM